MSGGRRARLVPAVLTVALGLLIAVQSRVNGELARHTHTGLFPAWWTMLTGACVLGVVLAAHQPTRAGLGAVIALRRAGGLAWWTFAGGVFGSLFLITQSVTVPLVGVAVFTVGVVAGQTSGALVVDRLGISPAGRLHVTANRVVAAIVAVAAVVISVSDRLTTVPGVVLYAAAAFLAGAVIAPQQAANGRIAVAAGSPFTAAFVNFGGGLVVMSATLALAVTAVGVQVVDPWGASWWAYTGGLLGLMVIAGAAWVVPALGVLVFSLLSVFGQLAGAFLLDLLAPTPGTSVGWHLFAGLAMTFVAVLLAAGRRRG